LIVRLFGIASTFDDSKGAELQLNLSNYTWGYNNIVPLPFIIQSGMSI